jgi:16S rRNA (guanine527-N7)-methyltransferase
LNPLLASELKQALSRSPVPLNARQEKQLLDYLSLMLHWNRVHNLTAITVPLDMVHRHLLDSLAVAPFLKGPQVLDVGTGAGLPGIPLAIALPELQFTLLDSNQKKVSFVQQVITSLRLKQVTVVKARVESYTQVVKFDEILARAFSSLNEFAEKTGHLCQDKGTLIAMKGQLSEQECKTLSPTYTIERIESLDIPGLDAQRCLVFMKRG